MTLALVNLAPMPRRNLAQEAAAAALHAYKRYASPYLGTHCRFDPSCSAYTYEAVQEYGVIKGSAMGLLRIARCNADSGGGPDPVPHLHPGHGHEPHALSSLPAAVSGPTTLPIRLAARAAHIAGGIAGSLVGGALGGLLFAGVGAVVGGHAGAHRLNDLNAAVARSMGDEAVVGAAVLERPLGMIGHRVWQALDALGAAQAAVVAGAAVGTLGGALCGAFAGARAGAIGGFRILGTMAHHFTLEKLGAETRPAPTPVGAASPVTCAPSSEPALTASSPLSRTREPGADAPPQEVSRS